MPWRREWQPHSSTVAWEIPWTEESGGLQSIGSQKSQTQLIDWTTTIFLVPPQPSWITISEYSVKNWKWKSLRRVWLFKARILEWVPFSFSRGSSQSRDRTQVSCIAADSLPTKTQGKPMKSWSSIKFTCMRKIESPDSANSQIQAKVFLP